MILELYLALLALSVVTVGFGLKLGEQYFTFAGLFFFFSLGILLLANGVTIKTGDTTETTYVYEETNTTLLSETAVKTYTYATGEDSVFWYGFLMSLCGGFGMFALLWNARRGFKEWDDRERGEK